MNSIPVMNALQTSDSMESCDHINVEIMPENEIEIVAYTASNSWISSIVLNEKGVQELIHQLFASLL